MLSPVAPVRQAGCPPRRRLPHGRGPQTPPLSLDRWAAASTDRKPIWTRRGIDFNVTSYQRLIQKLEYCHANPVQRGLVERPKQWARSSFNHYEERGKILLAMDRNGNWPLD